MSFSTASQLGPKQRIIGPGYLLCEDVPIARVGTLVYAPGEVPVPTQDGVISIVRDQDDVFAPDAVSSFNGMPVVFYHPMEDGEVVGVDPANWHQHSVGITLNPRRGDGVHSDNDFLYADLLIQDANAIKAVRDGMREVSAGYDAEYEVLGPGRGRQRNIVGNHVALVDRGRCGPRCSIGDHETMPATRSLAFRDAVASFRQQLSKVRSLARATGDAELVQEVDKVPEMLGDVISGDNAMDMPMPAGLTLNFNGAGGAPAPATGDVDPAALGGGDDDLMARLAALEQVVAALVQKMDAGAAAAAEPDGDEGDDVVDEPEEDDQNPTGDRARARVGDSTKMVGAFNDMLARAEVLAPGLSLPTFDAASPAKSTFDAMCGFRRRVLRTAWASDAKAAIQPFLGGEENPQWNNATAMTCDSIGVIFNGSSELMKAQRSVSALPGAAAGTMRVNGFTGTGTPTPAELNKRFQERYKTA